MALRHICILGSTGSIGTQALDVVDNLGDLQVVGLTARRNTALLKQQIERYHVKVAAVAEPGAAAELKKELAGQGVTVLAGEEGVRAVASLFEADIVLNALVGISGLMPTLAALDAGKDVALANKETLVCAGELVTARAKEKGVALLPVDSEHAGVFQCIQNQGELDQIILTASGGPFRGKTRAQLAHVTRRDALNHPNWRMGQKITIDSATLMNKGLEVIEAKWLFNLELSQIGVVVHPQSVVHAMAVFADGSVLAQLGEADMRLPIQFALAYPRRVPNPFKRLDLLSKNTLTFEAPDMETFGCLKLALSAIRAGGLYPAVLNGANEAAVSLFLQEKIRFLDIETLIDRALAAYTDAKAPDGTDVANLLEADRWARAFVRAAAISLME